MPSCNGCAVMNIQGVRCHERGCINQKNITLMDDGSLDTVFECADCTRVFRFNYQETYADTNDNDRMSYDQFVEDCIQQIEEGHDCADPENDIV